MGQPVRLSDDLVLDARLLGRAAERSIAGQIEFWAKLGRGIEPLLQGAQALALCRSGGARPLSACLDSVGLPEGRARVVAHLQAQPYPHYLPAPGEPGLLIREEADGTRTLGRFMNREFRVVKPAARTR